MTRRLIAVLVLSVALAGCSWRTFVPCPSPGHHHGGGEIITPTTQATECPDPPPNSACL